MNKSEKSHIHGQQMALIDKEFYTTMAGATLVSGFYYLAIYESVSGATINSWLIAMAFSYIARFVILRFVYPLNTTNSYKWEAFYFIATVIIALLWGLGSYFMMPVNNPLVQATTTLTVGGVVAAATVFYSPSKYIATTFTILALLPFSIFFFQQTGDKYFYMGALVSSYIGVMLMSHKNSHKAIMKSVMLGIKNVSLVDQLESKIENIESMAHEMSYQASHDMLTGLINRREFEFRLERFISEVKYNKKRHTLCYMDLDEFKIVNDTCGHIAGDALLKNLAEHLENKIRETDTVARLGGDEFAVFLPYCAIDKATDIAESIRESIKQFQFSWDDKFFDIGVSIGLIEINENTGTLTDVLKAADSACYVAKDLGKNRIHVYEDNDIKLTQRLGNMHYARAVQESLLNDRFVLYAQSIRANRVESIRWHGELLIRMLDENGKIIFPDKFIPAAERYHLMVDIDRWVINKAFSLIQVLEKKFNNEVLCAINLSGQSICDKNFLNYVIDQLNTSNISARSVCFEITETAAISNFLHAEKFLHELKEMGCKFSLDDFGSGLSSFGYLKRLDIDYLKIDGSFVKNMLEDEKDYTIVKSINQIGKEMGIKTIAEFVENDELHQALIELDVDYAQGYGIARPEPISTLIDSFYTTEKKPQKKQPQKLSAELDLSDPLLAIRSNQI